MTRISNSGRFIPPTVESMTARSFLRRAGIVVSSVRLMREQEGVRLYTARSVRNGVCFITGGVAGFAGAMCNAPGVHFPTLKHPVMNLSLLTARPGDRYPRVVELLGIVADGIAQVVVRFVRGADLSIRVHANTYIDTHLPQRPARAVIALTRVRRVVAVVPLWVPRIRRTP
jgi:hypothetical protein